MNSFSQASLSRLSTCHESLQDVFHAVINAIDCTILCGHRGASEQNRLFNEGKTQVQFPESRHNLKPSMAVDAVPYPVDWEDIRRFYYFAGIVMGIAASKRIRLRWGGDWNRDFQVRDNKFNDLPHFELMEA